MIKAYAAKHQHILYFLNGFCLMIYLIFTLKKYHRFATRGTESACSYEVSLIYKLFKILMFLYQMFFKLFYESSFFPMVLVIDIPFQHVLLCFFRMAFKHFYNQSFEASVLFNTIQSAVCVCLHNIDFFIEQNSKIMLRITRKPVY